uniref:Glutaredoxin and cysteine rich domain containing 2 n=1 Tax=Phasianus colchicus TaxID=9054 RepID=A0A669PW38_PHACC
MEEPQQNPGQRPRKVRFRISSACSGRVLKQVYEDGQALEPPAVEQSRRLRHSFEPGVLPDGPAPGLPQSSGSPVVLFWGSDAQLPARPSGAARLAWPFVRRASLLDASPVIDFGQIIIYTNNLKIIRAPMDQRELMRRIIQTEGVSDWAFVYRERRERIGCPQPERGAERTCSQCKGSGSAPCSLCHGSKFSMLANRFKESYRALRCPACNESGVQPCQVCAA